MSPAQDVESEASSDEFTTSSGPMCTVGGNGAGGLPEDGDAQQSAVENLGEVEHLDGTFAAKAGQAIDVLIPTAGDAVSLSIKANLPLGASGAKLALGFGAEAERTAGQVSLGVNVSAGVLVSKKAFGFKAYIEAGLQGFLKAKGDSAAECWQFLLLAMKLQLAKLSEGAADLVFGGVDNDQIIEGMDENDSFEAGLKGSVEAGFGAPAAGGGHNEVSQGASVTASTTYTRDGKGLTPSKTVSTGVKLGFEVEGVKGDLALTAGQSESDGALLGMSAEVSKDFKLTRLDDVNMLVAWASGAVSTIASTLELNSSTLGADKTREMATIAGGVSKISAAGALAKVGASKLGLNSKVSIGAKLEADYATRKGGTIKFGINREASVGFGDEKFDTVAVKATTKEEIGGFAVPLPAISGTTDQKGGDATDCA